MWVSPLYLVFYVPAITHALSLEVNNSSRYEASPCKSVCLKEDCPSYMMSLPRPICHCPDGYRCCQGKCPYPISTYAECKEGGGSVIAATDLPAGHVCCKRVEPPSSPTLAITIVIPLPAVPPTTTTTMRPKTKSATDIRCLLSGGKCQADNITCPGGYESGKCGGPASRKCCKPDNSDCINLGGRCQAYFSSCPGVYASAKCHDQLPMRCCNPGPADDFKCTSQGGVCQVNFSTPCHAGEGHYAAGICGGGNSRVCCLDPCSAVRVISRYSWSDRPPTSTTGLTPPASIVFIYHTAGKRCYNTPDCITNIKLISKDYVANNGSGDIGYNFLVGDDGFIYEGRGWYAQGAHTEGSNDTSIGISFMGNFINQAPTVKTIDAAKALIACSVSRGLVSINYTLSASSGNQLYFHDPKHWAEFFSII